MKRQTPGTQSTTALNPPATAVSPQYMPHRTSLASYHRQPEERASSLLLVRSERVHNSSGCAAFPHRSRVPGRIVPRRAVL